MKRLADKLKTCGHAGDRSRGLTINQIKWIALILMAVDHLAAYGFEIPVFDFDRGLCVPMAGRIVCKTKGLSH